MIPEECLTNSIEQKIFIKQEEILELVQESIPSQFLNSIIKNVQNTRVDEQAFEFLFRKLYPVVKKLLNQNKIKNTTEIEKLNLLSKIIGCISFSYEKFLEYFSDEDIVKAFEVLDESEERLKETIRKLLLAIFTKFKPSSSLFKEILANRLVKNPNLLISKDLEFDFKLILEMISKQSFGDDYESFYSQFILPQVLNCVSSNVEIVKNVINAFCSNSPECQRISLKFLLKSFKRSDTADQVKILEYTSKTIHASLFCNSKSFLEWEFGEIVNLAINSESYIVINSVIDMFEDRAIKRFIQKNIKIILPKIFENLYRLCKKFWKQEQRLRAIEAIGTILKIDHEVFETCLIQYNMNRHERQCNARILEVENVNNEEYCTNEVILSEMNIKMSSWTSKLHEDSESSFESESI